MRTKILIKNRVYELNSSDELSVTTDVPRPYGPPASSCVMTFTLIESCCNMWLHKYLSKRFEKNKKVALVVLLDGNIEYHVDVLIESKGLEHRHGYPVTTYEMPCLTKSRVTKLIDWSDVYNREP